MTAPQIRIRHGEDNNLCLMAPYHPQLVAMMRKLNGDFQRYSNEWHLDPRDESLVRDICRDVFGTDGDDNVPLVDLRLHLQDDLDARCDGVFLAGRKIARAWGRDSGAQLGPGVVVIQGRAPFSGGSVKNWKTVIPADSVLEVRDVPKPAADRLLAEEDERFTVSVVGQAAPDLEALYRKRDELRQQMDEVNAMIAGYEATS